MAAMPVGKHDNGKSERATVVGGQTHASSIVTGNVHRRSLINGYGRLLLLSVVDINDATYKNKILHFSTALLVQQLYGCRTPL